MINPKIALITAVAVVVAASPAFAQSFTPSFGTGNVLPFRYEPTAPQHGKIAVRQNGLDAFAMDPRTPVSHSNYPDFFPGAGTRRW